METGELLLVAAVFLFLIDFLQLFKNKKNVDKRKLKSGFYATIVAVGLIVVSYAILANMFIYDNFSLIEAYSYSSSSLSTFSKLRATWAGGGGSLMLLSLIIALVYFIFRSRTHENPRLHGIAANRILLGLLIFFLFVTIVKNPFATFDGMAPEGRGLNPSLQSIWMTVHPPIVFIGYAFILLSVALAFTQIGQKQENDHDLLEISTKIAWFFLTLGIATGGLWAYVVLGWGGYWSWDPVETASLMTWLALTAYFFIKPLTQTGKGLTKEFMILLTFEALIFLSALTRGSFRQSVHAYALSPAGPILLFSGLVMAVYFLYLKRKSCLPLWQVEVDKASLHSVSLFMGFSSLVAILAICFIGVITPIIANTLFGMVVITGIDFYNNWSFPFVMTFVLSLIGVNLPSDFGLKKFSLLITGLIVSCILLALLGFPTTNNLANIGLPFLIVGLLFTTYSTIKILKVKTKKISSFGKKIVHFGIIITLIGVLVSAGARQSSVFVDAMPNTTLDSLGIYVKIGNFTVFNGAGRVYAEIAKAITPEYTSLALDVEVLQDGKIYRGILWSYLYINYGFVSNPLVFTTEKGDIYLHLNMTESIYDALSQSFTGKLSIPENLTITVETVPLIYLVWTGVALLCVGITLTALDIATFPILNWKRRNNQ